MPTRIYMERDHTTEGLVVLRAILHHPLQAIFSLPAKIQFFFVKDHIDHSSKVYKGINHQTLSWLMVVSLLGYIRVWYDCLVHA